MSEQHDNLSDIPINAVLIGTFAEALKLLGDTDGKFPEFITIQGTGTNKATSRTYKFKTEHVRKYLEQLSEIIEQVLRDYLPHRDLRISDPLKGLYEIGPAGLQKMSTGSTKKSKPKSKTHEDEAVTELEDDSRTGLTGIETGSENGTETGTENASETGTETGSENSTETGSENSTETGTETGSENGTETGSAAKNTNATATSTATSTTSTTSTNMSGGARSGKRRARKLSIKKRK